MEDQVDIPPAIGTGTQTASVSTSVAPASTTATSVTPSPQLLSAVDSIKAAGGAIANAGGQEAAAQPAIDAAQASGQEALAAGDQNAAQRFDAEGADEERRLAAVRAMRQEDIDEARGMQTHDFYHDASGNRNVGRTIASGIGLLLGGLSANPQAVSAITDNMGKMANDDFARQKEDFARKLDQAKEQGADANELEQQFSRNMARLSTRQALAHQSIAEQSQAAATRASTPQAQAALRMAAAKAAGEQAKAEAEATAHLNRTVSRSSGGATTTVTTGSKGLPPTPQESDYDERAQRLLTAAHQSQRLFQGEGLSPDARDAVARTLSSNPKLFQLNGSWSTAAPDMFKGLSDRDARDAADAVRLVGQSMHATAGADESHDDKMSDAQRKEAAVAALYNSVPMAGIDTPDTVANKRASLRNTLRGMANRTSRPKAYYGYIDQYFGSPTQAAPAAPATGGATAPGGTPGVPAAAPPLPSRYTVVR